MGEAPSQTAQAVTPFCQNSLSPAPGIDKRFADAPVAIIQASQVNVSFPDLRTKGLTLKSTAVMSLESTCVPKRCA
ncbi:Uncharacterised protein [Chlamydia trachomatis]|nr:Uncharacterised protein [Chlamydia trachomatis]